MVSIQEALDFILLNAKSFGVEEVSIHDAYKRVLAKNISTDRDYPPFNRSAMDGYAVFSSDIRGSNTELKIIERLHAGNVAQNKIVAGSCIKIMTGAPVPEGADAVVKVEECTECVDSVVFNIDKVKQGQNIAMQAEDANKGDLIIPINTKLGANEIAVLAVVGKATVKVFKQPKVLIASTGNEIVPVGDSILPHQIRDSNSHFLKSFFKAHAIRSVDTVLIADDKSELKRVLKSNLDKDILILSGGVSKGDADYVPEVLASLGVKEVFHRVKVKPGAPLWFGTLPSGGVVFGLPGNPVAVQVAFKVFIEPYLRRCFGLKNEQPLYFPLLHEKSKRSKFNEYFPCKLVSQNGTTGIQSTKINGSGDISATLNSDGIALHAVDIDVISENDIVAFYPWNMNN